MTVRDGSLVGRRAGWVAAGAAALFVPLAVLARVDEGLLLRIDRPVNRAMLDLREPWLDPVMKAVSYLGSRWTVAGVLVALSLWSLVTGRARVTVLAMLLTYALTLGLQVLLKEVLVQRARPDVLALARTDSTAFPSGHVLAATGLALLLPALARCASPLRGARGLAVAGGVVYVAAMAVSRAYLGVHWATDTVGAVLLGAAVTLAVALALSGPARKERCVGGGGATEEELLDEEGRESFPASDPPGNY